LDSDKTATGIEAERFGKMLSLKARKEVVLSAGGIASPQLLLLSGIGPRQHLESLSIPVKHDLPGSKIIPTLMTKI
jgi:choline dehydrogenase-like flavoprotein